MNAIIEYVQSLDATRVNTIVTLVSIVCAIITIILSIKTWKYKKQVFSKIDAFDLVSFSREYHSIYIKISTKIRTPNSNKAGTHNKAINDLEKMLLDFNKIENKLPLESRPGVRNNVDNVLSKIVKIYEATADKDEIQNWKTRLQDIDRKLIEITDKMIKE